MSSPIGIPPEAAPLRLLVIPSPACQNDIFLTEVRKIRAEQVVKEYPIGDETKLGDYPTICAMTCYISQSGTESFRYN